MIIKKFAYSTASGNLSEYYEAVQGLTTMIRQEPGIEFVGPMPDPYDPARLMSMLMYDSEQDEKRLADSVELREYLTKLAC